MSNTGTQTLAMHALVYSRSLSFDSSSCRALRSVTTSLWRDVWAAAVQVPRGRHAGLQLACTRPDCFATIPLAAHSVWIACTLPAMQAASALRPSGLAARPTPARRACASKPRPTRPCIIVAATSDPSEGSGRPQAAAAAAAAGVIAAGVLLAHASPALAEDGSRGAAVITSPPTLEFPDQLAAPAAPQAPALRTSAQAAPHAGANDIVQASLCSSWGWLEPAVAVPLCI